MVTSKCHKTVEKHPFCGARLSINIYFQIDKPTTIISLKTMSWDIYIFHIFIIEWVMCTTVSFGFGSNPKKYLSLDRALTFQICLSIHPDKTGFKSVYYYSYYIEASFTMDVCPHTLMDLLPFLYKHNIQIFEFKIISPTYNKYLKVLNLIMIK